MWYVVETLGPPEATVVWSAGRRVEWGSLKAVQRMHGVNAAPIVEAVRLSGEQHSGTLRGRNTLKRVICEPTKGPDEAVHAVMLWVGAVDEMPSRAPSLGAMTWDVDTLVVQQTIECYMLSSETEEEFGATRDPALFLRKVFQFDHATELIELCFEPAKRSKFQGALTILHDDGHFMEWQGVAKYVQSEHLIRGFAQDLTCSRATSTRANTCYTPTCNAPRINQIRGCARLLPCKPEKCTPHRLLAHSSAGRSCRRYGLRLELPLP